MSHYQQLGIKETASKDEIKKAYNTLALRYHPDKNRATDAEEKFRAVNEAYKVLKDDHKRERYDRFELPLLKKRPRDEPNHHHRRRRERHDEQFFTGSSESYSEAQRYQNELDRIRRINSDLLDAANARLRRSNAGGSKSSHKSSGRQSTTGTFMGEIHASLDDDEYEKTVLDRIRALVGRN